MKRAILNRLLTLLISFALLFGAFPSFAATECCDPARMAMPMANGAENADMDHHKNIPSKMPADACAAVCVSMASVALIAPQPTLIVPIAIGEPSWSSDMRRDGVTDLPALPPPIALA